MGNIFNINLFMGLLLTLIVLSIVMLLRLYRVTQKKEQKAYSHYRETKVHHD